MNNQKPPVDTSMEKATSQFLLAKTIENNSPKTVDWYKNMLRPLIEFSERHEITLYALSVSDIRSYLSEEKGKELSERTIRSRYDGLAALLHWCEDEYTDFYSPLLTNRGRRTIKRPKISKAFRPSLQHSEFEKLVESIQPLTWVDARDRALITLLYTTGIRRAEILALQAEDLDFVDKKVFIKKGKGSKSRIVPFEKATRLSVFGYKLVLPASTVETTALWIGAKRNGAPGKPLQETGLRKVLQKRFAEADLDYKPTHSFRRGIATHLINSGADITFIQHLLGHSSSQITERYYTEWLDETVIKEHQRLIKI